MTPGPLNGAPSVRQDLCDEAVRMGRLLAELMPDEPEVLALNRAVAVAMAERPAAGLVLVDQLEAQGALEGYRPMPATRADLVRRLGRLDQAAEAYQRAIERATTDAERRYLARRLTEPAPHAEIAGDLG
jgi:RNA polymerase sigma-70 factor, ECF subfamily